MCAVDNLSFHIDKGETYGLVGESGCGKSTTGRAIVGLTKVDSGSIFYEGKDLCQLSDREFRPLRRELQMVFQDTLSALNPRRRIETYLRKRLLSMVWVTPWSAGSKYLTHCAMWDYPRNTIFACSDCP